MEIAEKKFFNRLKVPVPFRNYQKLKENLRILGVQVKGHPRDWTEDYRWEILERAAAHYTHWRKRVHPDYGGTAEQFIALQRAWEMVRSNFARRGYELHQASVNRDGLVDGEPFYEVKSIEANQKPRLKFVVSEQIKQVCLEEISRVNEKYGGSYGVDKHAMATYWIFRRLGFLVDGHGSEVLQVLRFMGFSRDMQDRKIMP